MKSARSCERKCPDAPLDKEFTESDRGRNFNDGGAVLSR